MQLKSFTAWINLQLAKVSLKVNDLKTELADGILLLKLVEAISGEELGKYSKNPVRVHTPRTAARMHHRAHAAHTPRACMCMCMSRTRRAARRTTPHPRLGRSASSRRSRT